MQARHRRLGVGLDGRSHRERARLRLGLSGQSAVGAHRLVLDGSASTGSHRPRRPARRSGSRGSATASGAAPSASVGVASRPAAVDVDGSARWLAAISPDAGAASTGAASGRRPRGLGSLSRSRSRCLRAARGARRVGGLLLFYGQRSGLLGGWAPTLPRMTRARVRARAFSASVRRPCPAGREDSSVTGPARPSLFSFGRAGACYHARPRATMVACPSFPTCASSTRPSRPRSWDASCERARSSEPLVLRGTPAELRGFEGRRLLDVRQRGKFLTLDLGARSHRRQCHADRPAGPGDAREQALQRDGARAHLRPARGRRAARAAGRLDGWAPTGCRPTRTSSSCASATPSGWARSTSCPRGAAREVAGWEAQGPDADDPDLDFATWQERIRRHTGELHALLKNQAFVAGIGNAYNDEILWAARLAPFRKRSSLAVEESERLWRSCRETLAWADRRAARPRAAPLRGAGARLPARPPQGRSALSSLRRHAQRGRARWLRDDLVPRLPGLTRRRYVAGSPGSRRSRAAARPARSCSLTSGADGHDDDVARLGVRLAARPCPGWRG